VILPTWVRRSAAVPGALAARVREPLPTSSRVPALRVTVLGPAPPRRLTGATSPSVWYRAPPALPPPLTGTGSFAAAGGTVWFGLPVTKLRASTPPGLAAVLVPPPVRPSAPGRG